MKNPLYAILVAPDNVMRRAIIEGRKKITIREGHRDYKPGLAMLCCHIDPWAVMVDVTSVVHAKVKTLTPDQLTADGYTSHGEALRDLKRFYPNLDMNSDVTVIRWDNVRGKLVDK